MRYISSKSLPLFLINFAMALLLSLGLSNLVSAYVLTSQPPDGLSNQYFSFDVLWGNNKNSEVKDLMNVLDSIKKSYSLYRTSPIGIYGMYGYQTVPSVDIVTGRNLNEKDFKQSRNVIIISQELLTKCKNINGKKYYNYSNRDYEVVGVYKRGKNYINEDALAIYNLASKNILLKDNYIRGTYNLDIGGLNDLATKALRNICSFEVTRTPSTGNSFLYRLKCAAENQGTSIIVIGLVLFMLLLNSVDSVANWLESRKKEIFIRIISGGSNKAIYFKIFKDYLAIITMAFIFGLLASFFISKILLNVRYNLFLGFDYSWYTALIIYAVVLCVGFITLSIMLLHYTHKGNIIEMARW